MNELDRAHRRMDFVERELQRIKQTAPTVPQYDLQAPVGASAMVAKYEQQSSPVYIGNGWGMYIPASPMTTIYAEWNIYIPSSVIGDFTGTTGGKQYGSHIFMADPGSSIPPGVLAEELFIQNDSNPIDETQWYIGDGYSISSPPSINALGTLTFDTWHTLGFSYVNGFVDWVFDGIQWDSGPQDTGTTEIGQLAFGYSDSGPGNFDVVRYYLRNLKIGSTSVGSSDLFNDPLGSNNFNSIFGVGNWTADEYFDLHGGSHGPNYPYIDYEVIV